MARETAETVLRHNILGTTRYSDTVVAVITVVAVDGDVFTVNADSVGVGWETLARLFGVIGRICVDIGVEDLGVRPRNADTPSNGLDEPDVGD